MRRVGWTRYLEAVTSEPHPYRTPAPLHDRTSEPEAPGCGEERALGVTLVVLSAMRLVAAVWCDSTFGAEDTVALVLAIVGLGILWRARR